MIKQRRLHASGLDQLILSLSLCGFNTSALSSRYYCEPGDCIELKCYVAALESIRTLLPGSKRKGRDGEPSKSEAGLRLLCECDPA